MRGAVRGSIDTLDERTAAELTEFLLLLNVPGLSYSDLGQMSVEKVLRYAVYLSELKAMEREAIEEAKRKANG